MSPSGETVVERNSPTYACQDGHQGLSKAYNTMENKNACNDSLAYTTYKLAMIPFLPCVYCALQALPLIAMSRPVVGYSYNHTHP